MHQTLKVKHITLNHFKNYTTQSFDVAANFIGIVGNNGKGKTNLIDAIYYSCIGKSYFTAHDALNFKFDSDFFRIATHFSIGSLEKHIVIKNAKQSKKEFIIDDIVVEKQSELVGQFPIVFIAPDDVQLILAGSEQRRKFFDASYCQTDLNYLRLLLQYNKLLQNRNALLKQFALNKKQNLSLLATYDERLAPLADKIFEYRQHHAPNFKEAVNEIYHAIFNGNEDINITYDSALLQNSAKAIFKEQLAYDLAAQRTSKGIHTDDWHLSLNDNPIKKIGSQGQLKTMLLALKLAQYQYIAEKLQILPILLLDDIFDKLDENRINQLIKVVSSNQIGQTIITDTSANRLSDLFERNAISDFKIINIE